MHYMWWLLGVVNLLVWGSILQTIQAIPPQPPVRCNGTACILDNAFGIWGDRKDCYVTNFIHPTRQEELRLAVAHANKNKLKVNVVSKFSRSFQKLACPPAAKHDSSINTTDDEVVLEDLNDEVEEARVSLSGCVCALLGEFGRKYFNTVGIKFIAYKYSKI